MLARSDWPPDYQETFWFAYPRRVAKKAAMKALDKVCKANEVPFEVLLSAVKFYARSVVGKDMKYVAHPATWLNAGRWDDDPDALLNVKIGELVMPAAALPVQRRMEIELDAKREAARRASQQEMRTKYPQWFK